MAASWQYYGVWVLGGCAVGVVALRACDPNRPARSVAAAVTPERSAEAAQPLWVPEAKPKTEPPSTAGEPTDRGCSLAIPGSDGEIIVFPTEQGLDEFAIAAASGDQQAKVVAARANGGFFAARGTRCLLLGGGFTAKHVRLLDGAREGAAGWVPTEWVSLR